ncbi:caspase family protein [Agrobacterium burrii]|uniref:Caspase family protein n=1 Tax=Agrobacterium burrii TaxID=2815339 RepID=A0ABS3EJW8_9HYPH|nr:caspase family protein [Agrobacterium burrii]MBO0132275.1 caspase family protein [Agrobacterium burrii]
MKLEAARVYDDGVKDAPRTHVLIIGVGHYSHGDDGEQPTVVGSGLGQLTSPPKSALAVAEWFIEEFQNPDHPLGTVTMLLSDEKPPVLNGPELPAATWANVRLALSDWHDAFQTHSGNMTVFYFCGHGVSLGQKAALLLSDFGNEDNAYEPAIDIDALRGTMRNAQPGKQVFLVDCCRTTADALYRNETNIGGRTLSIQPNVKQPGALVRQFLLFPSIDGQQAFGLPNEVSVFTSCFLDAVRFAGFDNETGQWVSTTALILNAIDRLVTCRLPADMLSRTVPTAMNSVSFEFNHIDEPQTARSVVTIDPAVPWPTGVFTASCINNADLAQQQLPSSRDDPYRCCVFEVEYGKWEFSGVPATTPPRIQPAQRTVTRPVAYVKLEVTP